MRILGIESSCDETAAAIIDVSGSIKKPRVRVLANVVSSQIKLHAKYGGVVPNLAKREHQRNFVPVLLAALREAKLQQSANRKWQTTKRSAISDSRLASILEREPELLRQVTKRVMPLRIPDIDAIAVTVGPGLAPALWVGVNFARALSYLWKKSLIPVNHLEGHIAVNLLEQIGGNTKHQTPNTKRLEFRIWNLEFPAIALLVSGGHTELVLMRQRIGEYRVIGETLDDAAGEAFDKVAKMLGLGFPGGPALARLAEQGDAERYAFPRPMLRADNFDFSFSGLKTSVLYKLRDLKISTNSESRANKRIRTFRRDSMFADVCASFQAAAVEVLVAKTIRAARQYGVKTVMIGGGVAANKKLRHDLASALAKLSPIPHSLFPQVSLTGDNALMIALTGWFNRRSKISWKTLRADANLRLDTPRTQK